MRIIASRGDTLVIVNPDGQPMAFPPGSIVEVAPILTTPAMVRRSRYTMTGIADEVVTLQPGDEGHARASFEAAGFTVTVLES